MYNMCVQAYVSPVPVPVLVHAILSGVAVYLIPGRGGIIAANIYRAEDAPHYKKGNSVLLGIVLFNISVYAATKLYYVLRNRQKARVWDTMSGDERFEHLAKMQDAGNKRLDFRFAS